jgi:hypothetical protein
LAPDGEFQGKLTFEALRAMSKLEFAVRETVTLVGFHDLLLVLLNLLYYGLVASLCTIDSFNANGQRYAK